MRARYAGWNKLTIEQQRVLLHCMTLKVRSCGLRFEGTTLDDWGATIECLDLGLVEIFIGEDQGTDRKGEACARLRLTEKGLELWDSVFF